MSSSTLSSETPIAEFTLGDITVRYSLKAGTVEFSLVPSALTDSRVERRSSGLVHPILSNRKFREAHNITVDSLVQVGVRGQAAAKGWTAGGTMRNGSATTSLKFESQSCEVIDGTTRIDTWLVSEMQFRVRHRLLWTESDPGIRIETTIENSGDEDLPVEMLSSFSLTDVTPFADDDACDRLKLHRFRSAWSNEGLHTVQGFDELVMERTWGGCPAYLRYGQSGSLPVRKFHPFMAVEDTEAGVFWGATLAWHGSWQMELYRRDDPVCLSGGLGDYEQSHWMKQLAPGEAFTAPTALVSTGQGDVDQFCKRLVDLQSRLAYTEPAHEADLPMIFNEWCSTWGYPSHDYLVRTAERLQATETKYLVIDDGWAEKPEGADIQFNGDWNVKESAFPQGLAATTAAIRERGLIPGIWFEFEPCTEGTEAFEMTDHQLQRDGKVLHVGNRHFWDFRDPWTFEYLTTKVIDLLRDNDFGYLKVDYNESIGLGCDGAESLGEGLRQHLVKVKEFFAKIRAEVPGIVIENCASGGHRLEPGMIGLTSMSSFSDAHETPEIPIIAAQLHRLVPVHKNQVWAVLRPEDTLQRLAYSLSATFLGRMCISGDLVDLSDDRFALLVEAQGFYKSIVPLLKDGHSRLLDSESKGRRRPKGWQALVRENSNRSEVLIVVHVFEIQAEAELRIPLPTGCDWRVENSFNLPSECGIKKDSLHLRTEGSFTGCAIRLISNRS